MNQLLKRAISAVEKLPAGEQEDIARLILDLAQSGEPEAIAEAHLADVLTGLAEAKRGDFATDAEVDAAFHRFG